MSAPLEDGSHHLRPPPDTFAGSAGLREENERLREALENTTNVLAAIHEGGAPRARGIEQAEAFGWIESVIDLARAALRLGGGR